MSALTYKDFIMPGIKSTILSLVDENIDTSDPTLSTQYLSYRDIPRKYLLPAIEQRELHYTEVYGNHLSCALASYPIYQTDGKGTGFMATFLCLQYGNIKTHASEVGVWLFFNEVDGNGTDSHLFKLLGHSVSPIESRALKADLNSEEAFHYVHCPRLKDFVEDFTANVYYWDMMVYPPMASLHTPLYVSPIKAYLAYRKALQAA